MSTTFVTTTLIELIVAGLLIYGYMHEGDVIRFEQNVVSCAKKLKKKVCRSIYNAIVKYETRKLKKAQPIVLTQPVALTPSSRVKYNVI